jgi:hypothetical protein
MHIQRKKLACFKIDGDNIFQENETHPASQSVSQVSVARSWTSVLNVPRQRFGFFKEREKKEILIEFMN